MALINCPECGGEISEKTSKCPKCGYMLNKPKRGIFGKLFKWGFISFNILMILWIISAGGITAEHAQGAATDAEKAGVAIGAGIGFMMIFAIWVIGDIILGMFVLFTRPKAG